MVVVVPLFPDAADEELAPTPELQPLTLGLQNPNDPELPLTLVKHAYCQRIKFR